MVQQLPVLSMYVASPYTKYFNIGGNDLVFDKTLKIIDFIKKFFDDKKHNIVYYSPVLANMHINADKSYSIIMEDCFSKIRNSDAVVFVAPPGFEEDFMESEGIKLEMQYSASIHEPYKIIVSKNLTKYYREVTKGISCKSNY